MQLIILLILLTLSNNAFAVTIAGITVGNSKRVYAVGDSITLGLADTPLLFGYRDHLQELLGRGTYDFVGRFTDPDTNTIFDVEHGGVSGTRTANVLARIQSDLNAFMPKPNSSDSKVLLFIGTNDSAGSTAGVPPPPVTPEAATANVVSIVNIITAYDSNINVYVATVTPHKGTGSVDNRPNMINFNAALEPAILAINATNPKVHLVDMYSAYVNDTFGVLGGDYIANGYASGDATHPSDKGHQTIALQWYSCIQSSSNTNCDGN